MSEELAEHHAEGAKLDEVAEFCCKRSDRGRLCEDIHCQVIRCPAQLGDGGRGTKQFERLRGMLSEQLRGVPWGETIKLCEDLVVGAA